MSKLFPQSFLTYESSPETEIPNRLIETRDCNPRPPHTIGARDCNLESFLK